MIMLPISIRRLFYCKFFTAVVREEGEERCVSIKRGKRGRRRRGRK